MNNMASGIHGALFRNSGTLEDRIDTIALMVFQTGHQLAVLKETISDSCYTDDHRISAIIAAMAMLCAMEPMLSELGDIARAESTAIQTPANSLAKAA